MSGGVVWLTGLPQSGKSTLAAHIASALDRAACILDSDQLRDALVPRHGYDEQGRDDFYASLANLAALLAGQGLLVLIAATANRRRHRERAREQVDRFLEVWLDVPAAECARRDRKGLYEERPENLPGAGADYEAPADPDVVASGGEDDRAIAAVLERVADWS